MEPRKEVFVAEMVTSTFTLGLYRMFTERYRPGQLENQKKRIAYLLPNISSKGSLLLVSGSVIPST